MKKEDFLIEIHTEELPPRSLFKLAKVFSQEISDGIKKVDLAFKEVNFFVTPRRIAVLIHDLEEKQSDQEIERKGPAVSAAFDANGKPSKACIGFAQSFRVTPEELTRIKNHQGEWVGFRQKVPGKSVFELLPVIVTQAAAKLPIPKRMRWGDGDMEFVRPVHSIIMLYGEEIIEANILGCQAGRVTRGHRFLSPDWITIQAATLYASLLKTEGYVIADFSERQQMIEEKAVQSLTAMAKEARALITAELLNEITGLVEWPVALCGKFAAEFLNLPKEILISAMETHQRYFPVVDKNNELLPYFVTISNIETHDPKRIIHGNERVLRARLADAQFFYKTDQKESLEKRIERLRGIIFQAKLGTMYDKAERLSHLSAFIAEKIAANVADARRAGLLAKADLTTDLVNEFPELQGVMGYYYALHDGEQKEIAKAIEEQYRPRFAGDELPQQVLGQVLAIADRIDLLCGAFGIKQIPSGDKDPYGLRRAAIGVLRILIEKKIDLDLKELIEETLKGYAIQFENADPTQQILNFIQERLRAWYQEQGVGQDVFAAVSALKITNPLDIAKRINAVEEFKKLNEAESLSIANKRVSNILAKYVDALESKKIDPALFENPEEKTLASQLEAKSKTVSRLSKAGEYNQVLLQLAELRQPIDDFFDHVMVMTEDKSRRENRILLLNKLRTLFLQVADIALLERVQ